MPEPATKSVPSNGVWRIGRGSDPLAFRMPEPNTLLASRSGNRFDSHDYGVLYFATDIRACFGETLARFRPSPAMKALVEEEWRQRQFMGVGSVPQEWRLRRTAVRVKIDAGLDFLDVEDRRTLQHLRGPLAMGLSSLGYHDLDVAMVRGSDRRVTRLISNWAYLASNEDGSPRYAGIRYFSRLDSAWELWAVFQDIELDPVETRPIMRQNADLKTVADDFELQVF
jgi:RES domain